MNLRTLIESLCKLVDPIGAVIETVNISALNDVDEFFETASPVILSIVNIEEDHTMKNQSFYLKNDNQDQISGYNPNQYFILSLLFASYNKSMNTYLDGIDKLNKILVFFQQNNSFFYKNDNTELITEESFTQKSETQKKNYQRVTMESVSLGIEQLNQMWSYLGSKYMPSMLYKMRFHMVQESVVSDEKVITRVRIDLLENDKNNHGGEI
ncbi:Pvc16 family protein [Chryseobacterium sp. Leaf394]|uniref:Pvc16 family protein n=1 Tax=Chryseobacterium sp. Leaf394 TaxID=1736361 RepID=UPI0006F838E2|nr:Pvc16 family protein [Chryseobacterium sp. Leaf394]KQS93191.1 hypothetical protein ASG21_12420 [Chryseobacterium sp. Leaf394]